MERELLIGWNDAISNRTAAVLVTEMASGKQRLVTSKQNWQDDPFANKIGSLFKSGKSELVVQQDGKKVFFNVVLPPVRLIIIGAVHITQTLAPMASAVGFDVKIIDPRTAFATKDRFPKMNLIVQWPQDIPHELALDPYTALVAVTHDPKIDDFPLTEALSAKCFYIGALGSKKTHTARLDRLRESGLQTDSLEQISAPIGLDIGASSPAEIAVAILAEMIQSLRIKNGEY